MDKNEVMREVRKIQVTSKKKRPVIEFRILVGGAVHGRIETHRGFYIKTDKCSLVISKKGRAALKDDLLFFTFYCIVPHSIDWLDDADLLKLLLKKEEKLNEIFLEVSNGYGRTGERIAEAKKI